MRVPSGIVAVNTFDIDGMDWPVSDIVSLSEHLPVTNGYFTIECNPSVSNGISWVANCVGFVKLLFFVTNDWRRVFAEITAPLMLAVVDVRCVSLGLVVLGSGLVVDSFWLCTADAPFDLIVTDDCFDCPFFTSQWNSLARSPDNTFISFDAPVFWPVSNRFLIVFGSFCITSPKNCFWSFRKRKIFTRRSLGVQYKCCNWTNGIGVCTGKIRYDDDSILICKQWHAVLRVNRFNLIFGTSVAVSWKFYAYLLWRFTWTIMKLMTNQRKTRPRRLELVVLSHLYQNNAARLPMIVLTKCHIWRHFITEFKFRFWYLHFTSEQQSQCFETRT